MFRKAIVGLDMSPAEGPIMECLPALAQWGIKEVVLVHIVPVGYAQGGTLGRIDDYSAWLNDRAAVLRQSGLRTLTLVRGSGTPPRELLQAAAEESADLVIVGSRSRHLAHEVFLGSFAKEVLRQASIPVLLERIEPTADATAQRCYAVCKEKLGNVLLATDFSEKARRAEDVALNFLPFAEKVRFLSVIEHDEKRADTEAKLNALKNRAEGFVERIGSIVDSGAPAAVIAQVAEATGATLIIVGKHGRGWLPGRVMGSTAESVCRLARRPVLMVPAG